MATYYVDPGNTNVVAWQANHVYSEGDYACPTNLTTADAKSVYECTTGGTSHTTTEPTWDETVGNTTSDGTVTWTARAPDSWDEALLSLQPAADLATAGDTVYCRGTQNLSAAIDFDTNSGTYDGGYIKFVGCNASGVNDGTRFTLKRTANTINGIYVNGVSFVWLENISIEDCTGTAGIALASAYADKWKLINVRCHNNTGRGASINNYGRYWSYCGCVFTANGGTGTYRPANSKFHGCVFNGNGNAGVEQSAANSYGNCIFHNNTGYGIDFYNSGWLSNCVVDGNGGGGVTISYALADYMLTGCRITNHSASGKVGVDVTANTRVGLIGCYFGNNATDVTAGRYDIIPINGATDHVILGGSDTNHGYIDQTADDFNLRSDASIRAYAVPLP